MRALSLSRSKDESAITHTPRRAPADVMIVDAMSESTARLSGHGSVGEGAADGLRDVGSEVLRELGGDL